jgi:hypothetical protein
VKKSNQQTGKPLSNGLSAVWFVVPVMAEKEIETILKGSMGLSLVCLIVSPLEKG